MTVMQVQAKQYTSAADMLAAARDLRNRIYAPVKSGDPSQMQDLRARMARLEVASRDDKAMIDRLEMEDKTLRLRLDDAIKACNILANASGLRDAALDVIEKEMPDRNDTVQAICRPIISRFPGVTWEDVISVRRTRVLIKVRHLCMYEAYKARPDMTLPQLGRIFKRDHTTILYVVQKMQEAERAKEAAE